MLPRRLPLLLIVQLGFAGCRFAPIDAPEGWDREPARVFRVLRAEGPLRAGAASVSLDPPYSVPMGGYFGGSELLLRRQRDPLCARAAVFEVGELRIGVVALDLVLIPPELRADVEARTDFQAAGLDAWTVVATHCHTAPGAFASAWPAQRFGIGSFDPLIRRFLAERSAEALSQAAKMLAPAAVAAGVASPEPGEPPLSFNRKVYGAAVDPSVRTLGLWESGGIGPMAAGRPLVRLVNHAAHPTMIPAKLRGASSDFPGVLCRDLDVDGSITIFLNGASGDIAAGMHPREQRDFWERRMERAGRRLAELSRAALASARPHAEESSVLAWSEGEILLPPRRPWNVPFAGSEIALNYPDRVTARCLRLGDTALIFFPGELGSDLGAKICRDVVSGGAARTSSLKAAWIVGLADDYLGYAFSREQHRAGGMSQHLTVYGEELGDVLHERLLDVARPIAGAVESASCGSPTRAPSIADQARPNEAPSRFSAYPVRLIRSPRTRQ